MANHQNRYLFAAACFLTVLALFFIELRNHNLGLHMPWYINEPVTESNDPSYRLQFPLGFPKDVRKRDLIKSSPAFRVSGIRYSSVIKRPRLSLSYRGSTNLWGTSLLRMFGFGTELHHDLTRCRELLVSNTSLTVSPKRNLNGSLQKMVARLVQEIDRGNNPYLLEFEPYLLPQIRLQVQFNLVDKFWFNMAGSSVFLKDYGYHMMVSRLAYSGDRLRNNPQFSFVYSQLYDANWNEVDDIALVVPSNMNLGSKFFSVNNQSYTLVHYPAIIPIPFYHNYETPDAKYLGPEDARVVLVRNPGGYEEPLLVFNMEHQKPVKLDDNDENLPQIWSSFRSMWVGWPWQFQLGKTGVDDMFDDKFKHQLYNRVKELKIKNSKREKTQKNWTPLSAGMNSHLETAHDQHLYFVYRWGYLQILKCDITSENGKCGFAYTVDESLKITSHVGPLRGGTPMVNLNTIIALSRSGISLSKVLPPGREVWVGFARAHFLGCGCGQDFYRPNLVVIAKDSVVGEDGKLKDEFRLTHISSFTSLDVEIVPWDRNRPFDICKGTNAIIPNGISDWLVRKLAKQNGAWQAKDQMTLSLSVSDCTVDVVHIRGLLNILMNMPDQLLFIPPADDLNEGEDSIQKMMNVSAKVPSSSGDNIVCAMEESVSFCSYYGAMINDRQRSSSIFFDNYDAADEYVRLKLYRDVLEGKD